MSVKRAVIWIIVLICLVGAGVLILPKLEHPNDAVTTIPKTSTPEPQKTVVLSVPYVSEAPDGHWVNPWVNACEEASITMVEKFYKGEKTVSVDEAKQFMQMLFDTENRLYGSNVNSDSVRTANLINNYSSYAATIKINPTVDDIKKEIDNGHPVISFHYGYDLQNPHIPFLRTGSYYHVMVVIGYDDDQKEFIANDDGDTVDGVGHVYGYDLFMNSLHDYVFKTGKANGPPTVLFTSPKT